MRPKSAQASPRNKSQTSSRKDSASWQLLTEFTIASVPGNEVPAMQRVAETAAALLSPHALDRLKTAVAEAVMNAIEHGNHNQPELPVNIQVLASSSRLAMRVTDQGQGPPIPEPEIPDIEAKLAGLQKPRGWGLFLIKNLMDELHIINTGQQHTLELILYLNEAKLGRPPTAG